MMDCIYLQHLGRERALCRQLHPSPVLNKRRKFQNVLKQKYYCLLQCNCLANDQTQNESAFGPLDLNIFLSVWREKLSPVTHISDCLVYDHLCMVLVTSTTLYLLMHGKI